MIAYILFIISFIVFARRTVSVVYMCVCVCNFFYFRFEKDISSPTKNRQFVNDARDTKKTKTRSFCTLYNKKGTAAEKDRLTIETEKPSSDRSM